MGISVRQLTEADAPQWLELAKGVLGEDYPDKTVYDLSWVQSQLSDQNAYETWSAENQGRLTASLTFLPPSPSNANPIANIGRNFFLPESYGDGSANQLLTHIHQLVEERHLMAVVRVLTSDNPQQNLWEQFHYSCIGVQPFKHMLQTREGCLFYMRPAQTGSIERTPLSESLSQVSELATKVLELLHYPPPQLVRDGTTGYPLQGDLQIHESTYDDFDLWHMQATSANPIQEISSGYNLGHGFLRITTAESPRALLAQRENEVVAGLAFVLDEKDRCVRITESFAKDDTSIGALFYHVTQISHEQFSAVYLEVDILMTAPRLLKSAEQLGFVPVAYLPAFYRQGELGTDVVKFIKLNMVYSWENFHLTTQAKLIAQIVDQSFQDQKFGVAIINLLRALPIFSGLGDGELRKIARLFTQKLYRPGERIFQKGDSGSEAYVVMRGQIDIHIEGQDQPIASLGNGQIFGELAFLDGAARGAEAVARQASILLVVQRSAFNELIQREPHLGMVVMRNIALELANRLRRTTAAVTTGKKT